MKMIKETLKKMGYVGKGVSYSGDSWRLYFSGDLGFELQIRLQSGKIYGSIQFCSAATKKHERFEELKNLLNLLKIEHDLILTCPFRNEEPKICNMTTKYLFYLETLPFEILDQEVLKEMIYYHKENLEDVHEELFSYFE